MKRAIWWIRRDLRLRDNPTLKAAMANSSQVFPVFIEDPVLVKAAGGDNKRLAFLRSGLQSLDSDLRSRGSRLVYKKGHPIEVLTALIAEHEIQGIFAEADFSPYALKRDGQISTSLPLYLEGGSSFSHPEAVLKKDGTPHQVYTPFMRAWKAVNLPLTEAIIKPPARISTPDGIGSEPIKDHTEQLRSVSFRAGENEANRLLEEFIQGENSPIFNYWEGRNRLDASGTSTLSPYLRLGMISSRQAVKAALTAIQQAPDSGAAKSAETWLNELIWREFYVSILYHFPYVLKRSFNKNLENITWENNTDNFEAWCEGRTGYPVVDAGMRQLLSTGWMHNRARMITASFLVKDLLIDWRWGEAWFMRHLMDGDPASNNGGWQWTAGTGTDAAPYFRIFNPFLQGKKFDPNGIYVRKWVPELEKVPNQYIHTPWEMPFSLQSQVNCRIGNEYPERLIDHLYARQRVMDVYSQTKQKLT